MAQLKSYMMSRSMRTIITITVIGASMMQLIDTSIVNVALPHIMGNLDADLNDASWVVTAYIFANMIVIPMSGWLAGLLGRKEYFIGSIALFVIASMLCGQADNIWELVAFRFLQGIGGGGLIPTSRVIMVESYPPEDLGLANALFGMGIVAGPTLGPTLGGWLTTNFSWRLIFYINLPVGLIALLMALFFVREPQEQHAAGKIDWWGILLLFVGFGALQVVLERGEKDNWFQANYIVILSIVAAIGIIAFIWRELVAEKPVVDLRVLRHRNFTIGATLGFVMGLGLYSSIFLFPVFVQNLLGYSAMETGLILLPGGVAAACTMPVVGILMRKKVPPQLLAGLGFFLFFIFSIIFTHLDLNSGPHDFLAPLIIRGVGLGLISVPIATIAFTGLFGRDLSTGSGLQSMTRQLGGSIGIALVGAFVNWRDAFHRNVLVAHLTQYSTTATQWIDGTMQHFMSAGFPQSVARLQSMKLLDLNLNQQSTLLTYEEAFFIVGIFFLLCIPSLLFTFTRKKRKNDERAENPASVEISENGSSQEKPAVKVD